MRGRQGSTPSADDNRHAIEAIIESKIWSLITHSIKLSLRERQIVECLLYGLDSDKRIASRLGMSEGTLHTHMARLYRKLSVTNRTQLIAFLFITYVSTVNGPDSSEWQQ